MDIVIIKRCDPDSFNARPPVFAAAAVDEAAAKQWIQDEVDGKHDSVHHYASGHDADWWLKYGTFRLTTVPVHDTPISGLCGHHFGFESTSDCILTPGHEEDGSEHQDDTGGTWPSR